MLQCTQFSCRATWGFGLIKPWHWVPAGLVLILGVGLAVGESMGWPFLAGPLQSQLQQKLGRDVRLSAANDKGQATASLHFWGGIRLQSRFLEIGAPAWSRAPYFLSAQDLDLHLRYSDVWRAWQGHQLLVQSLAARQLTVYLERTADGQASWQMAKSGAAPKPPRIQNIDLPAGTVHFSDAPLALNFEAQLNLSSPAGSSSAPLVSQNRVLRSTARGHYRQNAFQITLQSTGALPWEVDAAQGTPVAVKLAASLGQASLNFEGAARDFLHLNGLDGTFQVKGPSLAVIGEPLGVTLPTTPAFNASGQVQRSSDRWAVALHKARVGSSQFSGDFVFDKATTPPRLRGQLNGTRLKLEDLAPAVGAPQASNTSASRAKVLPSRPFDLASLRAMDADLHIAFQQVDPPTQWLEPLRPFKTHLTLFNGVLTLSSIEARTAQGHLAGTLSLNGQRNTANWVAALNWDGVQLQRWIHQKRPAGRPPYVSGLLKGHAKVQGQGRSTAEILATLEGDIHANVVGGTVSHLLVEMAGLDVAESLGVYLQGDDSLKLDCALADLRVSAGTLRLRLWVLDTSDSTLWAEGSLSLATEKLDLRAMVAPKDFSVLTLRAPVLIQGSFSHPLVTVENGPLGMKLGLALLLGLVNPLTSVLPLVDAGNAQEAEAKAAACKARMHKKPQAAQPTGTRKP